jgi:catechol 1,2-dioxygenase
MSCSHTLRSRRGFVLAGLALFAGSVGAQCRRTPTTGLGPYYLPAPAQSDLCQRAAGPGIIVTGRVLGFPECRPVAGATVEVWHANRQGQYSGFDEIVGDDLACLMRASVHSADDGRYSFRTLAPGSYFGRPQHIHFQVSAPGYRTLATQMYLAADDGIDPRLLARPVPAKEGGAATLEFDLHIAPV